MKSINKAIFLSFLRKSISDTIGLSKIWEGNMTLDQFRQPKKGDKVAIIKTNKGEIEILLFPEAAPKAVENFEALANQGYYNGVIFHRVIPKFMIQGGDPTGTGRGGESAFGKSFQDEFDQNYRNFYGALSMANAGPNTNGSQFFIVTADEVPSETLEQMKSLGEIEGYPEKVVDKYTEVGGAYWLDYRHSVFGQVVKGMDIVEDISTVERNSMDKPLEDVVMEEVIIELMEDI